MASSFTRFLDHTQQRITVGRTPLDEWTARCRDLYLTTHNAHKRQTSMPSAGFEPIILAGERPQTYALDGAATRTAKALINLVSSTFHTVFQFQLYYQCLPVVLSQTYSVSVWNVGTARERILWAERRFALIMVDDNFRLESFYTLQSIFKVFKSVHYHTFQINQPTRCNNFSSLLLDVYVQLNMFRASSCPSSGAQQLQ